MTPEHDPSAPDPYLKEFFKIRYADDAEQQLPHDEEGWRRLVGHLLQVRDGYRQRYPDEAELNGRPDYNFLLGQLGLAMSQVDAYEVARLRQEIEDEGI